MTKRDLLDLNADTMFLGAGTFLLWLVLSVFDSVMIYHSIEDESPIAIGVYGVLFIVSIIGMVVQIYLSYNQFRDRQELKRL